MDEYSELLVVEPAREPLAGMIHLSRACGKSDLLFVLSCNPRLELSCRDLRFPCCGEIISDLWDAFPFTESLKMEFVLLWWQCSGPLLVSKLIAHIHCLSSCSVSAPRMSEACPFRVKVKANGKLFDLLYSLTTQEPRRSRTSLSQFFFNLSAQFSFELHISRRDPLSTVLSRNTKYLFCHVCTEKEVVVFPGYNIWGGGRGGGRGGRVGWRCWLMRLGCKIVDMSADAHVECHWFFKPFASPRWTVAATVQMSK